MYFDLVENRFITVVEVSPFTTQSDAIWSKDEKREFINYIACNPLAGDEIQGTGGIRKIRWKRQGMGKRGGVRVIYFFYNETAPIFFLTIYAKGKQDNLTHEQRKKLAVFAKVSKARIKSESEELGVIMSKVGNDIIAGMENAIRYLNGEEKGIRRHRIKVPKSVNVKVIRQRLKLTQKAFASEYGFTLSAVREWEQGRRRPERSARILLKIIEHDPEIVNRILSA